MASEADVRGLLEQILDSGQSPEELCQGDPELLAVVRKRLRRLREFESQVDALFPPDSPSSGVGSGAFAFRSSVAEPPQIPGYEVLDELGHGGAGIVYRAWDLRLNRHVAVKLLLAGVYARSVEQERFQREAKAAAALRHVNIVQVYDVGEQEGRHFITMEFVEGGSLAQRLSTGPLPAGQAAALLASLSAAVQVAHEHGIIHRDLKPGNVLLTSEGIPKITDFGLARRLDDASGLTHTGTTLGTPSYMAPEQARGGTKAAGPAADVYALGAILYEMLTGRPPFRAETATATLQQVLTDEPAPPARLNARVPRDLDTICLKCLHKEPSKRYASAAELAEDLRRFERGEPISARPIGWVGRFLRWARRRPSDASFLAGGVLLAIGVVGGVVRLSTERSATRRAVDADLREAARYERESDWVKAGAALQRASGRLGGRGPSDLLGRLEQAQDAMDLVVRAEKIRLDRAGLIDGRFDLPRNRTLAAQAYQVAFDEAWRGRFPEPIGPAAEWVERSPVRAAMLDAIEDWAVCSDDIVRREALMRVCARPIRTLGANRLRTPKKWGNRTELEQLARTVPSSDAP